MATSMEADSEVLFKEKREGKGIKTETAVDDATLQFDFRATPATSPPGQGAEHRGGDGEENRRVRPFCCHATHEISRRRYGAFGPSYSPPPTDRSPTGNEVRGPYPWTERFSAPVAYT